MYKDILIYEKRTLDNSMKRAIEAKKILDELSINKDAVNSFIDSKQAQIVSACDTIGVFDASVKREDSVEFRVYVTDSYSVEDSDLDTLTEVMRKFPNTPYVKPCHNSKSSYRHVYFLSDKPFSDYEIEVLDHYMSALHHLKWGCEKTIIDRLFYWDGEDIKIPHETINKTV